MSRTDNGKCRVLVVEDEPLVAMVIEDMLESLDCITIGPVAQLSEAMKMASDDVCDCAILDFNIRGGNVIPVVDALSRCGVPFVIASGYSTKDLPDYIVTYPPLTKPYTSDQLRQSICMLRSEVQQPKIPLEGHAPISSRLSQ